MQTLSFSVLEHKKNVLLHYLVVLRHTRKFRLLYYILFVNISNGQHLIKFKIYVENAQKQNAKTLKKAIGITRI